jgi:hypothetical protein
MDSNDTQQEIALTELLEGFVPNLGSDDTFIPLLFRLVGSERGVWHSLDAFSGGIPQAESFLRKLANLTATKLQVVWLDAPQTYGPDYVYFHFYLDDLFWTKNIVYNRAYLNGV